MATQIAFWRQVCSIPFTELSRFEVRMNLLIIDNYDSFTFNLVHTVHEILTPDDQLIILKNDELSDACVTWAEKIIISPGPGIPEEAGQLFDYLPVFLPRVSTLGICLGHQAIGQFCGMTLTEMKHVSHGEKSRVLIQDHSFLFQGLAPCIWGGRYHSWCVSSETVPETLQVTALDEHGVIMAISHKEWDAHGVQFHPESFLTQDGSQILKNFCQR